MNQQHRQLSQQTNTIEQRQTIMENSIQDLNRNFQTSHDQLETRMSNKMDQILHFLQQPKEPLRSNHPPRECTTNTRSGEISAITGDTPRNTKHWASTDETSTAPSTVNSQHESGTHTQLSTMDIQDDDPASKLWHQLHQERVLVHPTNPTRSESI